jgi:hypothetical protein
MLSNTAALLSDCASEPALTVWLSRHVHLCRAGSAIIALDLARDRYFGLTGRSEQILAAAVPGWPQPSTREPLQHGPVSQGEMRKIIRDFISQGVLTAREADGKMATPVALDLAAVRIAIDANVPRLRDLRFDDALGFLGACVSTSWSLRRHSLQNVIEAVGARKKGRVGNSVFDVERAADLVAIFRRLRSFVFSGHRRCLFHALTLVRFLARYGVYPDFVVGVKVDPWAAHSWVQCGEYVLDGTPEQVRFFTPILVV